MSAVLPPLTPGSTSPTPVELPKRGLLTGKSWGAVLVAIVVVAVLVPVLNLAVPEYAFLSDTKVRIG